MKRISHILLLLMFVLGVQAQMADPVHFKSELKTGHGAEGNPSAAAVPYF